MKQAFDAKLKEHAPLENDLDALAEQTKYFPKMVVINSTYLCNASCIHCPYTNSSIRKEERAKQYPYILPEVFRVIADQVGEKAATLRISGAGEPFLNSNLVDYICYAHKKGCKVGVINNGSLFTEEKAIIILEHDIEMIEFSVDAADPKTYAAIRKGLNFEKTLNNIERAVALREKLKANTKIIVSVVNQKLISDKIDEIVTFWKKRVDQVQVRKYLTWDINDLENSGDITPYLEPDKPCPFPFDRMLTDTNGDVRFCVYDIKGKTRWGNVLEQSISEIWQNESFNSLRSIHKKKEFHKMEICDKCLDRQFRSWNYNYFHLRETAGVQRND